MINTLRDWLGLGSRGPDTDSHAPLRALIETLEHLEPDAARYLARFAYLLGRVARADLHVSPEETRAMETVVVEEGGLTGEQAVVVVGLAKSSNLLFGSSADFQVANEFNDTATYEQKLGLMRCLFRVAGTDASISMAEESEIHRLARQFQIQPRDLTALRVAHAKFLPGLSSRPD